MTNNIVEKTLSILQNINKNVTAHLNNNSFGITTPELDRDDEYNMASFVYYELKNVKSKDQDTIQKILSLGEYLVLGSYIYTKLGGIDVNNDLRPVLYNQFSRSFNGNDGLNILDQEKEYLQSCLDYGLNLSKKTT